MIKFIDRTVKDDNGNVVGYHIRKIPECEPYAGKYLPLEEFAKAERESAMFQAGKEAFEKAEKEFESKPKPEPVVNDDKIIDSHLENVTKKGRRNTRF